MFLFSALNDIVEMAKKGHFQIACSKYFDAAHNTDIGLGINHPNQYFEESQKLLAGNKVEIKKETKVAKKEEPNSIEEMDFDEISEWNE